MYGVRRANSEVCVVCALRIWVWGAGRRTTGSGRRNVDSWYEVYGTASVCSPGNHGARLQHRCFAAVVVPGIPFPYRKSNWQVETHYPGLPVSNLVFSVIQTRRHKQAPPVTQRNHTNGQLQPVSQSQPRENFATQLSLQPRGPFRSRGIRGVSLT